MEEDFIYQNAKTALEDGKPEEVLRILNSAECDQAARFLFLKGEACYHLQRWGDSLNYFRKVLVMDPEDSKAKTYIDMIQGILSFYHTDFFNP